MARFSLIDAPIESFEDDCLGIGSYVEAMHQFIKGCETPLTIGIQGDWGIGKTSFLKMLIQKFSTVKGLETRCHTIYFNSWQYAQFGQDQTLSLSILRGIVADLEELIDQREDTYGSAALEQAQKFGAFVRCLGAQVLKAQTGIDIEEAKNAADDPDKKEDIVARMMIMKKRFQALVSTVTSSGARSGPRPDKLVIIIDDLDRLKPIRALEFLEAVKNFLDVPGCVFLLAIDYAVIQRGMVEKLGRSAQQLQGKSYFDKIIQVPFNMPTGAFDLAGYVLAMLGREKVDGKWRSRGADDAYLRGISGLTDQDAEFFVTVTWSTVGTNPRSIKRSVSYAALLKLILLRGSGSTVFELQDAKLLYALACLQLAWPEVFAILAEDPVPETVLRLQDFDEFERNPRLRTLLQRVHNRDEVKTKVTAFLDALVGVVDKDDDGNISPEEFQVIPDLMGRANLMAVAVEDLDGAWTEFSRMIRDATRAREVATEVQAGLDLLRKRESEWNDRRKLRLVPAGKRLLNVLWEDHQIGSLVTTQKDPLQFYLKCDPDHLASSLGQEGRFVRDVSSVGHWGVGDSKVELVDLARTSDGVGVLNRIHEFVLGQNGEA